MKYPGNWTVWPVVPRLHRATRKGQACGEEECPGSAAEVWGGGFSNLRAAL